MTPQLSLPVIRTTALVISGLLIILVGCQKPPVPELTAVDPTAAKNLQRVTLFGEHLTYFDQLMIGNRAVDYDSFVLAELHTNAQIVFVLPPDLPAGESEVFLIYEGGETERLPLSLLGPGPTISRIIPDTARAGERITIIGQNLSGPDPRVLLNEVLVADILEPTDTSLQLQLPDSLRPGPVSVSVEIAACPSNTLSLQIVATPPKTPVITSISPNPARVGDTLTISGSHFLPNNTTVRFSGQVELSVFLSLESERIQLIVPPRVQAGIVEVSTTAAETAQFADFALLPRIETVQPNAAKSGSTFSITGWNLAPLSALKFNDITAPSDHIPEPRTDTTVNARIPAIPAGNYTLTLATPTGPSNSVDFIVVDSCQDQTPLITAVANAIFSPGDTLTITGNNLLVGTPVISNQGGINFPLVGSASATTLRVRAPDNLACGSDSLFISTTCGTSAPFAVEIDKTPLVDPPSPAGVGAGEALSLNGAYFEEAMLVISLGNRQLSADSRTATTLTFTVPADLPPDDYELSVMTTCGTSAPVVITVEEPDLPPLISNLEPGCQVVAGVVTISGDRFPEQVQVLFDDVPADILSQGPTELTVSVPGGFSATVDGSTVFIEVVDLETGQRSQQQPYRIFLRPTISSFLPKANARGGPLFIRGENMANVQQIRFNGTTILRRSAGEFLYAAAFREIGMNVPGSLSPGEVEICFDISRNGCTVEQICQEKRYTVTSGSSQHPSPNPGNPTTFVFPSPPPGISLPTVSNDWRVFSYDAGGLRQRANNVNLGDLDFTLCFESDGEELLRFGITNGADTAGVYRQDGNLIRFTFEGKDYEGRQHRDPELRLLSDYDGFNPQCPDVRYPLQLIFTPIAEGDQLEFVYPFIIDSIEPAKAKVGTFFELDVFGRGLTGINEVILVNQSTKEKFTLNFNFDNLNDGSYQEVFLPTDLPVGRYDLYFTDDLQLVPSNVVTFEVTP